MHYRVKNTEFSQGGYAQIPKREKEKGNYLGDEEEKFVLSRKQMLFKFSMNFPKEPE